MNRDEIAVSLLPSMLEGATGLGVATKEEREEVFALTAQIAYEISDAMIKESSKDRTPKRKL